MVRLIFAAQRRREQHDLRAQARTYFTLKMRGDVRVSRIGAGLGVRTGESKARHLVAIVLHPSLR